MAGLLAVLVLAALGVVGAALFISSKLRELEAKHRRAMQDLVLGHKSAAGTVSQQPDANQCGGIAQVFVTPRGRAQPVDRRQHEAQQTAALVRQLGEITRTARGKDAVRVEGREAAMVRAAEREHRNLVAQIESENREPRTRPPGPCTLQISYVDAQGEWTTRKIALYKSGNTNQKFDAWCEVRQARRTFYFERIRSAMDLTTGQSLTLADVFQRVHPSRRIPVELR